MNRVVVENIKYRTHAIKITGTGDGIVYIVQQKEKDFS